MNTSLNSLKARIPIRLRRFATVTVVALIALYAATAVLADVHTRIGVRGTVPLPGTQQQELANITFPAPYNVFEFLVTCGACHGGQVDQQVAHFGNWAGSSMASASRDPVFRASEIILNTALQEQTGLDGGGNMCFRCHSPNGWYSGRFDPFLNGSGDGSQMIHSILLSTDDEGVPCEMCHRTMGAVTYQRSNLDPNDPVWNMLAGIDDWPHNGNPFVDQEGDPTLVSGNPLGNGTLQLADGMTYIGRYPGTADIYWKDNPQFGTYTGQTYGVYPLGWIDPFGNDVGGQPATGPNGELLIQLDIPIGPPLNPDGSPNYNAQSVSPEHSTVKYPNTPPAKGFIQTSEFCGACHEQTTPVLNHGMPDQRTYTEWKYSAFSSGPDAKTCQDCHMPRLSHEYSDDVSGSFNSDPYGEPGGWPYSKARTNTAVHKLAGANLDLPAMMTALYPEVDIEVVGGGEGAGGMWVGTDNDPRIFPGMLSRRDPMWLRNLRNTEIILQDGVDVEITQAPILVDEINGIWEVKVKVTNLSGHRLPSGFSEGQRMWIDLMVSDSSGVVYQSGFYDDASATLMTDSNTAFNRALGSVIDSTSGGNAVMVYERLTGMCSDGDEDGNLDTCDPSFGALNDTILFDNRIPPTGFDYDMYRQAGVKFWSYGANFVPFEDATRYTDGRNWDEVTYRFNAPSGAALTAQAAIQFQSHTREYMEFLREADTSTLRPEGPPRPWSGNYPLDPNYLSDEFPLADVSQEIQDAGFISAPLRDNWGGIAYAAWYVTGKGAPFAVAIADMTDFLPGQVTNIHVYPECDPVTGVCVGAQINPDTGLPEAYTQRITWNPVAGAESYLVWIKYGAGMTASWDKLAIVQAPTTELINTAINVDKTYVYKIQALNGAGYGPESLEITAKTPWDVPLMPENLRFVSSTATTITMSWYDGSDNETGWAIFRQDVPDTNNLGFKKVADFPSTTGFGGVFFTDGNGNPAVNWAPGYTTPQPGRCYNYVVEAFNTAGTSGWNANGPVQMCARGTPPDPSNLLATVVNAYQVDLNWADNSNNETGFRIQRALDINFTTGLNSFTVGANVLAYSDMSLAPNTIYYYRVFAFNAQGDSLPTNTVTVLTPDIPPAAPSGMTATASPLGPLTPYVNLAWNDNANNETGFAIERMNGGAWVEIARVGVNVGSYQDATVTPKTTYTYRVRGFNFAGYSNYATSNVVVTPGQIPEAPSNLRITAITKTSITIVWNDNSTNEQGFYIERSLNGTTWVRIATVGLNVTTFQNTGLKNNTTYWYRVQAFNADGATAYTAPVFGRTKK